MRTKNKNLVQDYDLKLGIPLALNLRFYFSFLVFFLLISCAAAQVSSEQLDPSHLLVAYLMETSQDLDRPNIAATASRDMNTPSGAEETLQDVNAADTGLQPDRQEQSQTAPDPNEATDVNSVIELGEKSLQSFSAVEPIPDSRFGFQLWHARIATVKSEKDNTSKAELQRMIEQIRSVRFEPTNLTAEPVVAAEPALTAESNEPLSDTKMQSDLKTQKEEVEEKQIESKNEKSLPYQTLTNQTLQVVKSLSQHPEQVDNPIELAEILFRSGHLKEAAVFYQEVLNRRNLKELLSAQDRAWILFQTANCLRNDDLPRAIKMYRQLISEYPDSLWTDLAKSQEKLISWYQEAKPKKLVQAHNKK